MASQAAPVVKNLPAREGDVSMQFWLLGREDSLEEGMTAHSSLLAWWISWTEETGRVAQSWTQLKPLSIHTCTHAQINSLKSVLCLSFLLNQVQPMTLGALLMAQWWRIHLPMQEMRIQSPGREDPLEKEMATHFNILAWEIPWTEEQGGL